MRAQCEQHPKIDREATPIPQRGFVSACNPNGQNSEREARQPDHAQTGFGQDTSHLNIPWERQFAAGGLTSLCQDADPNGDEKRDQAYSIEQSPDGWLRDLIGIPLDRGLPNQCDKEALSYQKRQGSQHQKFGEEGAERQTKRCTLLDFTDGTGVGISHREWKCSNRLMSVDR